MTQLIIGNFGLSYDQSRTQMAVWSVLAAPLLMSVDLRTIGPEYRDILLNPAVIAVSQDPLGIQGTRVSKVSVQITCAPYSCFFFTSILLPLTNIVIPSFFTTPTSLPLTIIIPQDNNIEIWTRPISPVRGGNHSFAVAVLNRGDGGTPANVSRQLWVRLDIDEQGYSTHHSVCESK